MASLTLVRTDFAAGRWQGVLSGVIGAVRPRIIATHQGETLGPLVLSAGQNKGELNAVFEVPSKFLSEGVQTIFFIDETADATLDTLTIMSGEALSGDLRAELQVLRDELEMLKRAFRRHCNDNS